MHNKLILLLLPLLFLASPSAASENNFHGKMSLSQAIDKVRNAIVQVRVKISHSQEEIQKNHKLKLFKSSILGTGFFVNDDGYVVTANHVVSDFINDQHARLKVYVAYQNIERKNRI
ncbi:MAG: S1C family serine protease, partial [Deltaproteobacteria bacterium]